MNQNPYLKQYQKTEIETATPEKLLILLYDGAIQFLNKAKIALNQKDVAQLHNNLLGCENILLELMRTLNRDANKDLAQNLYDLYEFLYNTLIEANVKQDEAKINFVLEQLSGLRATWIEAIKIANSEAKMEFYDEDEEETEDGGDQ